MFEVMDGARRLFWTEHQDHIPGKEIRKQMRAAGLRLILDGRPFLEKDVKL